MLEHYLSIHAVDGVEGGLYRWRAGELELRAAGPTRDTAQYLCYDQPLGGDSAYTAFHAADLALVLPVLGARGYRCAQFEAGVAAGRLQLAAFALGVGATGLTFFDDLVSQAFGTESSCMLVTSVGVPDSRPAPAGRPGQPVELGGFDRLMLKLAQRMRSVRDG